MFPQHPTVWAIYAMIIWLAKVGYRDALALSLLGAWGLAEVFARVSHDPLPLGLYFLLDAAVISIVMADDRLLTRSVICLYPLAWAAYVFVDHARTQWFILWAITMVQFLLAGLQCEMGVHRNGMGRLGTGDRPLGGGGAYPMALHLSPAKADQHAERHVEHGPSQAIERR